MPNLNITAKNLGIYLAFQNKIRFIFSRKTASFIEHKSLCKLPKCNGFLTVMSDDKEMQHQWDCQWSLTN